MTLYHAIMAMQESSVAATQLAASRLGKSQLVSYSARLAASRQSEAMAST
jgi:hypothetical protein